MISLDEALRLASRSSKYEHSKLVSSLMGSAATQLGGDRELWMLVGLLHDIDYDETRVNTERHGLVAAEHLIGWLPVLALDAIKRHDHRSGFNPVSDLDYALILCDAISLVLEETGLNRPLSKQVFDEAMTKVSDDKPWLNKIINENPLLGRIDLGLLLESK